MTHITGSFCQISVSNRSGRQVRTLQHHTYDLYRGWVARDPAPHPLAKVEVSLCKSGYEELDLPIPRVTNKTTTRMGMTDTGAQMVVGDMALVHSLGITRRELIPLANRVNVANDTNLGLIGGILIKLTATDVFGNTTESRQLCYISDTVQSLFLSREACENLGFITKDFPNTKGATLNSMETTRPCQCPDRALPPKPSPPPANIKDKEELKRLIEERYAASAFNQCEHQPLPLMTSSPPLQLHVDSKAIPVAVHKAVPVPIHWQQQVKAELDRDVRLGVLEQVPIGAPTTWCSRMVVCPKKDGSPRRTVDLQCLNRAAVRQTHATESPFHQAASIPRGTLKTVLDCWNGYHSIPLAEADRHYTTFTTPWGCYRYLVAPQGFLAAGDAYTARFDKIVSEVENFKKCIDDTCLWDGTLAESFESTSRYLTLCSEAGIVFNKKKFQFACEEVEYLGFTITPTSVKPSKDYLQAIQDFPRPRDITGIRSWYGLINQVNYAFSQTDVMLPFRSLLKPTTPFLWTQELQEAFDKSKEVIIKAVEKGVETFDMGKITCLATDWSKTGMGFCLLQKQCRCSQITPICCKDGWTLVFAGSRFTSGAESRYAPVEGEALGVAWALDKCKHFVLGCPTLIVAVDHKPLLKLLGDKNLEDIENPRLLNFKEKTRRYSLVHVPCKDHSTPDATSRHPTGTAEHMEINSITSSPDRLSKVFLEGLRVQPMDHELEESLAIEQNVLGLSLSALASTNSSLPDPSQHTANLNSINMEVMTWSQVKEASSRDSTVTLLAEMVRAGLPEEKNQWPAQVEQYYWARDSLTTVGPVVLYRDRIVVPTCLQPQILDHLHSAHQGVSGMSARATAAVYWPGMQDDIIKKRAACSSCNSSTPSQPAPPPTPLPQPSFPFEQVCSDYFSHGGKNYLIVVDRYSGWLSIYSVAKGEGAEMLIKTLKTHFCTFGISSELASDGGAEYKAASTQRFLRAWGVHHRLSSAYYPHSNQRAELGVKSAKRLIRENISPNGSLETDSFRRGLLGHRNTPDRDTGLSPAQVIFGRPIREFLPIIPMKYRPRPEWRLTMEQRELALARRHTRQEKLLTEHTRKLPALKPGDVVMVQNQTGRHPLKWDKSGMVIEASPYDQYKVKMDGSGRVSARNRRFLKQITPYTAVAPPLPGHGQHHPPPGPPQPELEQATVPDTSVTTTMEPDASMATTTDPDPAEAAHMMETDSPVPDNTPTPTLQPAQVETQGDQTRRSGRARTSNTRLTGYELYSVNHGVFTLKS